MPSNNTIYQIIIKHNKMKINAEVKQVISLKDYFFIVPDYQREYVWEKEKNVQRFLQDINDEFNPKSEEQKNYFIGSTIIVKRDNGQFDVIDGQQRLTTIVIFLCAMRKMLNSLALDDDLREKVEEKNELLKIIKDLLYEYSIQSRKKTPRLELQYEDSKDYLLKLIEDKEYFDEKTNSIIRMIDAYKTVFDFLEELGNNDKMSLINFIRYFLVNVEMVIIQPDDIGSALKIFETINERGVGLNAMDLLKNLLFINANEDDFVKIKEIWKEIVVNLQNCGEGDKPLRFLRYFFVARYHNGIIREEEIYKWIISNEGKAKIKYERNPLKLAKEILRVSEKYQAFIKATGIIDADLNYPNVTGISYLTKNARQPFILLLALKDSLNNEAINLLAKNVEALMFYYAMNKVLTKYYESLFADLAIRIREIKSIEELKKFIKEELSEAINKQRINFDSGFENRNQMDIQPQYRIKYIFGKVEEFIRMNVNFPSNNFSFYQEQQLEHILPQTGMNIPKDKYPEEYDYSNAVCKIGNLTLLEQPINGSLNFSNDISSNEWFKVKVNAYKNSNIILTKTFTNNSIGKKTTYNKFVSEYLKHFDYWDRDTIKKRQQILKKLMLNTWTIDTN